MLHEMPAEFAKVMEWPLSIAIVLLELHIVSFSDLLLNLL